MLSFSVKLCLVDIFKDHSINYQRHRTLELEKALEIIQSSPLIQCPPPSTHPLIEEEMKPWSIGGTLVSLSHAMKTLISIYELVLHLTS